MRWAVALCALPLGGCSDCAGLHPVRVARSDSGPAPLLDPELRALRPRFAAALRQAHAWLDRLHVDPLELRAVGIKGKKKLVEQLDAYYRIWQLARPADRPALHARIREVVAITYEDRYHDMLAVPERHFKQDATSYLRAALLMERLGLDTARYREEIGRIHGRLNRHMARRGPHQRRIFHVYYKHFGLGEPFALGDALQAGLIAGRSDPRAMQRLDVYALTHEVYAVYEYGDRLHVDPFDAAAKRYLRAALGTLVSRYIDQRDPDLVAELVECLHYLRMQRHRAYLAGVRFLLDSQNDDGSWGRYPQHERRLGRYVQHGYTLHTTLVAVAALIAVFERPMPAVAAKAPPR